MAEGIQGIEKVKLGDWVFDARVGVAEKLTAEVKNVRIPLEKFTGIKAGKEGFEDMDGILGLDLESSFIVGLREAGARGFKLTFQRSGDGRDNLEILKDFDKEKGVIWYKVDTSSGEPTWELVLTNVSYKDQSFSVPRGTKVNLFQFGLLRVDARGYWRGPSLPSSRNCTGPLPRTVIN